ncbi:MAG: DUF1800 domain-containing protein [Pseudomonadota bacterium]
MPVLRHLCAPLAGLMLSTAAVSAAPDAMDAREARHVLSRTGFGAAPHEVDALIGLSYTEAVARIVEDVRTEPSSPMPPWTGAWPYPSFEISSLGQTAEELFFTNRYLEIEELSAWWLSEMIATPAPLTERMVLFWHDHFATSFVADENPQWMAGQNALFRRHAAGNFRSLAARILRDPAMLSYLSNTENFKDAPNENLGREYLELFTLGQGRGYSEDDVKEVARALTGHSVGAFNGGEYAFYAEDHDRGRKTILGRAGRFDAVDLPDLVISDPAFGPYIVEKLWLHFVSDTPDGVEIARLAALWKAEDLEMKPLLSALFLTEAFWAEEARGRLVKSPVDLLVGAVRTFGFGAANPRELAWAAEEMGQALFFPPNVGGWTSGTGWITDATAVSRSTVMTAVVDATSESFEHTASQMMMARGRTVTSAGGHGPTDLRVGQVFALEAQRERDGTVGMFLSLFDVSFGGSTFRSLPIYIEEVPGEAPGLSLYVRDCAPACPFDPMPETKTEEDGWIWVPLDPEFDDEMAALSDQGRNLLATFSAHLPRLLKTTRAQMPWSAEAEYDEDDVVRLEYADAARLADAVADAGGRMFGPPPGDAIVALSTPGVLGLSGLAAVQSVDDIDTYLERLEDLPETFARPTVIYPDLEAWVEALPSGTTPRDLLIATPFLLGGATAPSRDPVAAVRSLILSPQFQLN